MIQAAEKKDITFTINLDLPKHRTVPQTYGLYVETLTQQVANKILAQAPASQPTTLWQPHII